jgi:DNA-binding helix-hairpin-helix protein with protein kinase domain
MTVAVARRLGAGGEAEVFEVADRPRYAFKKYRVPSAERAAKLRVMLASPPSDLDAGGHVAIAWPRELVVGPTGQVEGFLMPRIDLSSTVPLFQVYNPASRLQTAPGFTWRYLLRTARNVAAIVDSLHRAGYVVGDINESNLLVNRRALAVLVDCDSMQVRDPATGVVHHGGVGKPEFTAPELLGRDLSTTDRTAASDDFAVAVLVFQLLLEGVHPFSGIWRGRGEPPDVSARIRAGHFPYRRGSRLAPPPHALALEVLPPSLRKLVWRTFTSGVRRPSARPSAAEWMAALESAESALQTCDRSVHHVFSSHLRRCPWCARIDTGMPDPFPGPTGRSALERRPPSRSTRARTWLSAWSRAAATAVGAALARGARRAAGWLWTKVRGPLTWTLPAALAAALLVALVPVPALVLLCLGARSPVWRTERARTWIRWRGPAGVAWPAVLIAAGVHLVHGPWWWPLP